MGIEAGWGLLYIVARSGQCGVRHKGHGAFKWPKAFVP